MLKSEAQTRDEIPDNFEQLEDFWAFWDTHSTADYEDLMEPVEADITWVSAKRYYPIAKDIIVEIQRQARHQGVSPETLINLWLQERLANIASV